jgi:PadR family transcriptional regulator PadR
VPWADGERADWNAQVRKGVLSLCALGLIARGHRYGYEIVQELALAEPLAAAEGTVYPLLRRLKQAGWLETYWRESDAGPPRQYYRITPDGRRVLQQMRRSWRELAEAVALYAEEEAGSHARAR